VMLVIRKDFPGNYSVSKPRTNEERVMGFLR
jgi:hypothetical protein